MNNTENKSKPERQTALPKVNAPPLLYRSILVAAFTGFLCGYSAVGISAALVFIYGLFQFTTKQVEIVVSIILLAYSVGAIAGWPICKLFGRRFGIFVASVLLIAGPFILAFSQGYHSLLLGRIVLGLGIGLSTVSSLIYISEIVPPNIRGSSVCILNLMYYFGAALAYAIAWGLVEFQPWRVTVFMGVFPAIGLLILVFYIPETPQWYLSHGKLDKAKGVLESVRHKFEVDTELEILQESVDYEKQKPEQFWKKGVFRAFFIGIFIAIFMEITGLDAIIYYAPTIVQLAGRESIGARLGAGFALTLCSLIFGFLAIILIDMWGRRRLLLLGIPIVFASLIATGIIFKHCLDCGYRDAIILLPLIIFAAGFAFSLGTVGWLLISEIYPLRIRSFAVALTLAIKTLANYAITRYFLSAAIDLGTSLTFWIYAAFSALAWVFVYFFVPETAGKRLEEIEAFWLEEKDHGTKIEA